MKQITLHQLEHQYTYYKTTKMRLGNPFRNLDNLFIHWLKNYFGSNTCFDHRFLNSHNAKLEIGLCRYHPTHSYGLYPNQINAVADLKIAMKLGARAGIKEWVTAINETAFDFDVLDAIRHNLMAAKLVADQKEILKLGWETKVTK